MLYSNFLFIIFPGGLDGKVSAYSAGDPGSISGSGRSSGEDNGSPLQLLPGKSHGQKSLVGYSPWGHKESDTTERLHFLLRCLKLPCLSPASHLGFKSSFKILSIQPVLRLTIIKVLTNLGSCLWVPKLSP